MTEFYALVHGYDARYPGPDQMAASVSYRLENAADKLSPAFARVEVRRRPDRLWVTDADALVDYALSTSAGAGQAAVHAGAFRRGGISEHRGLFVGSACHGAEVRSQSSVVTRPST